MINNIVIKNGDLLKSDCSIICHQVNCQGVMGAGLAKQIRAQYPNVYNYYIKRCKENQCGWRPLGGTIDAVPSNDRIIINMYAQNNYGRDGVYTDYEAFRWCLNKIRIFIDQYTESKGDIDYKTIKLGFPCGIGCGLAGGNWNKIYDLIYHEFYDLDYPVEIWRL